jgi:hypothetical protein
MTETTILVQSCAFCGEGVERVRPTGGQMIVLSGDGRQLNFPVHLACLGARLRTHCRASLEEYARIPLRTEGTQL